MFLWAVVILLIPVMVVIGMICFIGGILLTILAIIKAIVLGKGNTS